MGLFDATLDAMDEAGDRSIVFANFVDFDTLHGHRRNVEGYAAALEEFDRRLPELEGQLRPGDLVLITADHGCDPTFKGTDHTREHVPVLFSGPGLKPQFGRHPRQLRRYGPDDRRAISPRAPEIRKRLARI